MLRQPCWLTNLIGLVFGYGNNEDIDLPLIYRHYRLNTTIGIKTAAYCVIQIEKHDDLVVINHPTRGCYITTVGDLILENHPDYHLHLKSLGYTKIVFVQGAIKILDHPLKYIRSHKVWVGSGTRKIAVKYYSDPVEIKVLPGDFDLPLILEDDGFYYFDDENYFRADYQQSICRFETWLQLRDMLNQIRII